MLLPNNGNWVSDSVFDPESSDFIYKDLWRVSNKHLEIVPGALVPEIFGNLDSL